MVLAQSLAPQPSRSEVVQSHPQFRLVNEADLSNAHAIFTSNSRKHAERIGDIHNLCCHPRSILGSANSFALNEEYPFRSFQVYCLCSPAKPFLPRQGIHRDVNRRYSARSHRSSFPHLPNKKHSISQQSPTSCCAGKSPLRSQWTHSLR